MLCGHYLSLRISKVKRMTFFKGLARKFKRKKEFMEKATHETSSGAIPG